MNKNKYLFDKIELYDDYLEFKPFRKATIKESFLADTQTSFNQDCWSFRPVSFRDFLKMLEKTKLNENSEYNINTYIVGLAELKSIDFDDLLKAFAAIMYSSDAPNEKKLAEFYSKAYQIKKEAKQDKSLLDRDPSEFIK